MGYGVKVRVTVAVLAFLMFNWPILAFFRDESLEYLYVAWFIVVISSLILSVFSDPGKMQRKSRDGNA